MWQRSPMLYMDLDEYTTRTLATFASSCFRVFAISLIACASNCATLNLGYTLHVHKRASAIRKRVLSSGWVVEGKFQRVAPFSAASKR